MKKSMISVLKINSRYLQSPGLKFFGTKTFHSLNLQIIVHGVIMISLTLVCTVNIGPVHTNPDIFESATFSFWIQLPSTRIRQIQRMLVNLLSRVEKINPQ